MNETQQPSIQTQQPSIQTETARADSAEASRSFDVHLLLLDGKGVDTTGTFTGPLPAADDMIDVRCRSRRIHLARVTHLDPPGRFPIWAAEIETSATAR